MITICIAVYVAIGLIMIGSLALLASRPAPQHIAEQPVHELQEAHATYDEAESLRRAA